jgi:hypothetical protein
MSIQQSLNQMLGTAGLVGALYANTPAGKAKFETKDLTRKIDRIKDAYNQTETDEQNEKLTSIQNQYLEKRALLNPDTALNDYKIIAENDKWLADQKEKQNEIDNEEPINPKQKEAETHAVQSQVQKVANIQEQKSALTNRKDILKEFKDDGMISNRQYKHLVYKLNKQEENKNG